MGLSRSGCGHSLRSPTSVRLAPVTSLSCKLCCAGHPGEHRGAGAEARPARRLPRDVRNARQAIQGDRMDRQVSALAVSLTKTLSWVTIS
eukprot:scaffold130701_cov26-Prasinocladus_malaysianus.AAC.1